MIILFTLNYTIVVIGINCQTRFVPDSSKIELGKYGDP